MNAHNVATIYLKELRDSLRDRRTLISMIVVPTLAMPLLVTMVGLVSVRVLEKARTAIPAIMVIGGDDSPRLRAALAEHAGISTLPAAPDWRQQISDKKIRAAVEIPPAFDAAIATGAPATVRIYEHDGELRSAFAVGELRRLLAGYRDRIIAGRLAERGLPATLVSPFNVQEENVAPPAKVGGNVVGGIIPYFFLLLAFTGAMYPAMDLTAGEKERGTLETILCSPVARSDLVAGKFLMVLTASLGTVLFSLLSMAVTVVVGGAWIVAVHGDAIAGGVGRAGALAGGHWTALPALDPLGLLAAAGMVLPMAVLFSATLLAVSLFAKSFKEAQTYVSPLVIVILLPALIGMLPGVELNTWLALVPVLNVSLVSKELVSGVWHWNHIVLIFGSSCAYAAVALGAAVRMFNRESVLFRM